LPLCKDDFLKGWGSFATFLFDLLKLYQIILTTRDEEAWFESWKNQFKTFNRKFHLQIMWALSPMGWAFHRFFANCRKYKDIFEV